MKRFLRNELYQMVHYKHFQMANLRLVYLTFYTVRGFYTIFNRKNLPKIIPLDPLMSIGNILQFNNLFKQTFTMITLFFALINYFYLFSKKTSLTWNIIYGLIWSISPIQICSHFVTLIFSWNKSFSTIHPLWSKISIAQNANIQLISFSQNLKISLPTKLPF